MTASGPNTPTAATNDTGRAGTLVNWSNSTNAQAADDSRATATNDGSNGSEYLVASSFGFSIPAGGTIGGVVVGIERKRNNDTGSPSVKDALLYLVKGSTIQTAATNQADTVTNWPIIDTRVTYGTTSDLWGVTLASSDVNATGFGVALAVDLVNGATTNVSAEVDAVDITIHYSGGGVPRVMHHRSKTFGMS